MSQLGQIADGREPTKVHTRLLLTAEQWRSIAQLLRLSPRELQILQCIFEGQSEGAIAPQLDISAYTVHAYVGRIYRKLGVHSRCELIIRIFAAYVSLESKPPDAVSFRREAQETGKPRLARLMSPDKAPPIQTAPK